MDLEGNIGEEFTSKLLDNIITKENLAEYGIEDLYYMAEVMYESGNNAQCKCSKKYEIEGEENVNLNKIIFNEFAKENITIFEMKKPEASLEDAFMKIIKEGGDK